MNGSHRAMTVMCGSLIMIALSHACLAQGNPARGQQMFGACAPCHSLVADENLTGPSLAHLWGRKAGSLASFERYSPALKSANIIWDAKTLDQWITDPQHLVPGNQMTFPGIKDAAQRTDLLAFLKEATERESSQITQRGGMGGMGGMMGGGQVPNLKNLDPTDRVQSITYCKDTYTVVTADGKQRKFWERNLRLKTDASKDGPQKNVPALVDAGMMGDRGDVIFADPSEIGALIVSKCE